MSDFAEGLKKYVEKNVLIQQDLGSKEFENDEQMKNNSTEVRMSGNFKITVTGMLGNDLIDYLEPQEQEYTEEYTR